jgi:hypothetical protein
MNQEVHIKLKDLFGLQSRWDRMLNRQVPIVPTEGGSDVQVTQANSLSIQDLDDPEVNRFLARTISLAETLKTSPEDRKILVNAIAQHSQIIRNCPEMAMKTPKLQVTVGGRIKSRATIDCGAEVNVMNRRVAESARLPILSHKALTFVTITGDKFTFAGYIENVPIDIGGIRNHSDFMIVNESSHDILLGMPFILESKMSFDYPGNGIMQASFMNADRTATGRVIVGGDVAEYEDETENS